ncbi:MAG: PD40 domain-containing protein [Verrucomicrobia bacterium]|nr:PD40 domain-containing protein [Verrucomicrobiota bacterium]
MTRYQRRAINLGLLLGIIVCFSIALPARAVAVSEREMIEQDWRKQDGIGTQRNPAKYEEAISRLFERGDALLRDLQSAKAALGDLPQRWEELRKEWQAMVAAKEEGTRGEQLWRRVHELRRQIVFRNPLAKTGPLLFVKQVPSMFSHQLTQYYGSCARPGGGMFVLDEPGRTMRCRQLAKDSLQVGSFQHADVSYDGKRVMFAYCQVDKASTNREEHANYHYHLYEMASDGSRLRQLTDGPFDDFAPRYLPDGRIIFISSRRGGFHRCGRGPCPTYTLALANGDGSDPHPISFHETHEWDPAVLNDGRVIYTRWDYVDRNAVHYQQLWSVRPDGTDVRAFYGNYTLNPVGVWEAQAVPGSSRVMATAAAHHAMTAGSIILLDVKRGVDGLDSITRLTPDALFPESEEPVSHGTAKPAFWRAPGGGARPSPVPPEAVRWPGHCYRSPWPLSEKYFLAAYSYDPLIGEPSANPANMFGLYFVDAFGNKELLYRDPDICSLWPVPLRARPKPPALPLLAEAAKKKESGSSRSPHASSDGIFFLENVYNAWPRLTDVRITRLRVVQVLPKTTPHINTPSVGVANASPGKQVLGTVPVEADGSAYFRAPAKIALAFQALDEHGQSVQTMRSITYLQPGESVSCVGCHEQRSSTPSSHRTAIARTRPPSTIMPGPDGSKPLSYPLLVQPVLDKHCVSCHGGAKPAGKVALTGEAQGHYSVSYNALIKRVSFSSWGGKPGDFRVVNSEPLSQPGFFGARGSPLMKMLQQGHHSVALSRDDADRLATWMDANALFYGTFDVADQARQQRGERIEGPKLE